MDELDKQNSNDGIGKTIHSLPVSEVYSAMSITTSGLQDNRC